MGEAREADREWTVVIEDDNISERIDGLEYRPETGTYRTSFSHDSRPPSRAVVETVAEISDVDVEALDHLFEVVDPEALDDLFVPTAKGGHRGDGEVSFDYCGYEVSVRSYGVITVRPAGDDEDDAADPSPS